VFDNAVNLNSVADVGGDFNLNSLTFGSSAGAFTLSGSRLRFRMLTNEAVAGKTYRLATFGSTNYGAVPANLKIASGGEAAFVNGTFAVTSGGIDFTATSFQPVPVSPMWLTLPTGIVLMGASRWRERSRKTKHKG
jgi:hypothetical protein